MRFGFSRRTLGILSVLLVAALGITILIVHAGRKEVNSLNRKYMQGEISQECVEVTNTVVTISNQLQGVSPRPSRPKIVVFCDRDTWQQQRNAFGQAQNLDIPYLVDFYNGSISFNALGLQPVNDGSKQKVLWAMAELALRSNDPKPVKVLVMHWMDALKDTGVLITGLVVLSVIVGSFQLGVKSDS